MAEILRIATRKSQLALWQANYVRKQLLEQQAGLQVELMKITTQGDKILDTPLAQVGGKGLFIKELERALLDGRAEIAVHSMKDLTVTLPVGLHIAAICKREDPRDAFVSNTYRDLGALPEGSRVGTSSLRRQCQLRAQFPHLTVVDLRGNVNTRLRRLDNQEFDAVILAAAGLIRLGLKDRIRAYIDPEQILPAVGQGAVGVECRTDADVNQLLATLDHTATRQRVDAERALNRLLGGGCQVPIGGHAELSGNTMYLRGLVGYPDGRTIIRSEASGQADQPERLGEKLAADLINQGAQEILDHVYRHSNGAS